MPYAKTLLSRSSSRLQRQGGKLHKRLVFNMEAAVVVKRGKKSLRAALIPIYSPLYLDANSASSSYNGESFS